jgi:hypothetical protein
MTAQIVRLGEHTCAPSYADLDPPAAELAYRQACWDYLDALFSGAGKIEQDRHVMAMRAASERRAYARSRSGR